jgi:putative membrane protein
MSHATSFSRTVLLSNVALVAMIGVTACKGRGEYASDTTAGTTAGATAVSAGTAAPAASATLADPQIAHVVVTANSLDSAAGAMARPKARNAQVKDFAQTMVRDHTALNKQSVDLARKLNVTPAENDVSRQLQQDAEKAKTDLAGKTGADYDKAYIDHEVQMHQTVLDAIDKTLIPGAQNAELKGLLEKARPTIAAHLDRAKNLQTTLGRP